MGGIMAMVMASLRPVTVAACILNDVGPSLNPEGLRRIGAYAGSTRAVADWTEAASVAAAINGAAFPAYGPADWDAFARRLFEPAPDGTLRPAYDPEIAAPIRAAGPDALAPDITPLFLTLATGRPMLLVRGGLSDLVDAPRAEAMRALAPHMAYAEVPNVGHAPTLDEPEAREAIAALLKEAP
jgi:pimeloyl-ACP methyl ester carboxylesterase